MIPGIDTKENSPIENLMENLAKDLVELEQQQTDSKVIGVITETYQSIYNELLEIQKGN